MTKGELWKGVSLRLITAIAFGGIAYFAVSRALSMVAIFGEGMGVDQRSKDLYSQAHVIVHVFSAVCAVAIGVFHYYGHKWLRRGALAAVIVCGGYGIINMIGFTSTNRVAVAAAKDAGRTAVEREYLNARSDILSQIDWLQKTAAQEDGRERRRLLNEVDAKRKELSALKAPRPTADTVLSDAHATTMAGLSMGFISESKWQTLLPAMLAVFIFSAEAFSLAVVGHMVTGIIGMIGQYRAASPVSDTGNSGSGGGGKSKNRQPDAADPRKVMQADTGNVFPLKAAASDTADAVDNSAPQPLIQPTQRSLGHPVDTKRSAKTSRADVADILRGHRASEFSGASQRAIAEALNTSQPTVCRAMKEVRGKVRKQAFRNARPNHQGGAIYMLG